MVCFIIGQRFFGGACTVIMHLSRYLTERNIPNMIICENKELFSNVNNTSCIYQFDLSSIDVSLTLICNLLKPYANNLIIHGNRIKGVEMGYMVSEKLQVPYVSTVHLIFELTAKNLLMEPGEQINNKMKEFYRNDKLNNIIAVSKATKESLINYGFSADSISVIYNAVEDLSSQVKEEPKNKFRIGYIGRLSKEKGVDILIKAIDLLKTEDFYNDIEVVFLGKGEEESNLLHMLDEYNLNNCNFVGFKENAHQYLGNFDLLVVPSRKEAFGMSIIEAMNLHIPIIAAKTGGIPEIIHDMINGLLFEPENPYDLYGKIKYFIRNYEKKDYLVNNAYHDWKCKYSTNIFGKTHLDYYKKIGLAVNSY